MLRRMVVRGASMEPTLREGQRLLVGALRGAPRRGDLVVAGHPRQDRKVVKRVAAVPGDTWQGHRLGPGEYAVRGDNPAASSDSAAWGPLRREALLGRVLLSYRPLRRVR